MSLYDKSTPFSYQHRFYFQSISEKKAKKKTSYPKKHFTDDCSQQKINKNDKLLNRYIDTEKPIKTELQKKRRKK